MLNENKKRLLVFWATWCGPCSIELGRINRLILSGDLKPDSVLAISSGEDKQTVQKSVEERKYLFPVATDEDGHLALTYKVSGTPTIYFINEKNSVEWASVGLSPSLEFRIKSFFN